MPKLSFTDEKLAAFAGRSVQEMDAMPVSAAAIGIVYDAFAQSKSGFWSSNSVLSRFDDRLDVGGMPTDLGAGLVSIAGDGSEAAASAGASAKADADPDAGTGMGPASAGC